jgi:prepilin-type N-terminal cleavage/methylation domain-containing protein
MNRSHMARARYRRRRRGFTIVEVIVSIMVMVVGVLGLASTGAVVQRLIGAGVGGSRASLSGYAARQPVATNATAAGRARNRRVEIVLTRLHGATTSQGGDDS